MQLIALTSLMRPSYILGTSSHIGAVKGWWELLQRPCARNSLSSSACVNNGNSVIHRKLRAWAGSVRSP